MNARAISVSLCDELPLFLRPLRRELARLNHARDVQIPLAEHHSLDARLTVIPQLARIGDVVFAELPEGSAGRGTTRGWIRLSSLRASTSSSMPPLR